MGKHSTDLCALKGKLHYLLEFGPSKIELSTESAHQVGELTEFAIQKRTHDDGKDVANASYEWIPRDGIENDAVLTASIQETNDTKRVPGFTWKN